MHDFSTVAVLEKLYTVKSSYCAPTVCFNLFNPNGYLNFKLSLNAENFRYNSIDFKSL